MANKVRLVDEGTLEIESVGKIAIPSSEWLEWADSENSFRYCPNSDNLPFTARRETTYWYGYRKQQGKLHKRYIGKTEDLTIEKLEEVAIALNLPSEPRSKPSNEPLVTDILSVTEKKTPTDETEIERLWLAISELREQIATQPSNNKPLQSELHKPQEQAENLADELERYKRENQELHNRLQETERLKAEVNRLRELNDELMEQKVQWYEALKENPKLKQQVEQLETEVTQGRLHIQQLEAEVELHKNKANPKKPDYDSIRDRILEKFRVGRQSTAGKAITTFIKELCQFEANQSEILPNDEIKPL